MKRRFEIGELLENNFVVEKTSGKRWHAEGFRVLYADTDKSSVVYHANYLKYFEVGRAGLIRATGRSYKDIEEQGYFHPIVDLRMQFEYFADYDDLLSVYARPLAIEPVRFSYDYVVCNHETGRLLVHGHTVHCCIDREHRVKPVDPVTRTIFADFGVK